MLLIFELSKYGLIKTTSKISKTSPMNFDDNECLVVLALLRFRKGYNANVGEYINKDKVRMLEHIYRLIRRPSQTTINDISLLQNIHPNVIRTWFIKRHEQHIDGLGFGKVKMHNSQLYDDNASVKHTIKAEMLLKIFRYFLSK